MKKKYLESGKIVNTHGTRGEVKIQPWCDDPDFLTDFQTLYIDEKPFNVLSSRVSKTNVLVHFEGIDDINAAVLLKNKVVFIDRDDVELEDGYVFVQDLLGISVIDENGNEIGKIAEVIDLPSNDVYVIKGDGGSEILIPAVDEFILEKNIDEGYVKVRVIEGM